MLSKRRITITEETTTTIVNVTRASPCPCPVCGWIAPNEAVPDGDDDSKPLLGEGLATSSAEGIGAVGKIFRKIN